MCTYTIHIHPVQKHVHIPKDIWYNHFPAAQPSTFLFSPKSTNSFCLLCSEHCLPGAVWEVENPGHRLIWPCDAGAAQRNGTALCHEDPQQAEGQCGSGFRRVFKCACHLRTVYYRTVIDNTEMSLMRKPCSQALNTVCFFPFDLFEPDWSGRTEVVFLQITSSYVIKSLWYPI